MSKPRTPPRVFGGVGVGAGSGTSAGTSAGTFGTPAKPLTTIQWQIPGVAQSIFYTDEAHHSPNLVALSSEIFPERRVFALWDVAANKKIPDETIQRAREIFENGQVVAPKGQQGFVYNTTTEGGRWKLKIKGALGYMRVYPHETPFRAATGESLVRFTSIAPGH